MMGAPDLDSLLQTCVRHNAICMHLLSGHAPGVQLGSGEWNGLQMASLSEPDLEALAEQLRSHSLRMRWRLKRLGLQDLRADRFHILFRDQHIFEVVMSRGSIWLVPGGR
jgi:hypothetical protein